MKNGRPQWLSLLQGHETSYTLYFHVSPNYLDTWVIEGGNNTLLNLTGLETFWAQTTYLPDISYDQSTYKMKFYCFDTKLPTSSPTVTPTLSPTVSPTVSPTFLPIVTPT